MPPVLRPSRDATFLNRPATAGSLASGGDGPRGTVAAKCGGGTAGTSATIAGFEWALTRACASGFDPRLHADRAVWSRQLRASPVRVQWDPERSLRLAPLPHRSLQVGLSGAAVHRYVDEWPVRLTDVTPVARAAGDRLTAGDDAGAAALLPVERPYPLPPDVARVIDASSD